MSRSEQQEQQVRLVAESIARYLETRPTALDSLEGILRWWLLKQHVEESAELVQAAMDHLVSNGVVTQVNSGGKVLYTSARQQVPPGADNVLTKTS